MERTSASPLILIVEDERRIARLIELELVHEGFSVMLAGDGITGERMAREQEVDLILLDWMLPGMDGIAVCQAIRKKKNVPIILLTAKDTTSDKVAGLDAGADDYITKPFETEELLARIRAALRKGRHREELRIADLLIFPEERRAFRAQQEVELTTREFDLLHFLAKNVDKVVSRDAILETVWGYDFEGETNVVDVYIRYVRLKVDEPFATPLIHTIRGVGYVLRSS